jgi:hypothetical protein
MLKPLRCMSAGPCAVLAMPGRSRRGSRAQPTLGLRSPDATVFPRAPCIPGWEALSEEERQDFARRRRAGSTRIEDGVAHVMDIPSTILDAASVSHPVAGGTDIAPLQGKSLPSVLADRVAEVRCPPTGSAGNSSATARAVWTTGSSSRSARPKARGSGSSPILPPTKARRTTSPPSASIFATCSLALGGACGRQQRHPAGHVATLRTVRVTREDARSDRGYREWPLRAEPGHATLCVG